MKTISEYLAMAVANDADHAWDQWEFRWSAEAVAKAAASRGEISRGNVRFLADRICAAHEAAEATRLAAAQAAASTPEALAAKAKQEAEAREQARLQAEAEAKARAEAESKAERRALGAKLRGMCGSSSNWTFGCYSNSLGTDPEGGRIVYAPKGNPEIIVARLVSEYVGADPDCNKYIAWGIPNDGTTTRHWESVDGAAEILEAYELRNARIATARAKARELRNTREAKERAARQASWKAEREAARRPRHSPVAAPATPASAQTVNFSSSAWGVLDGLKIN